MARIEKTVFISYRRANGIWARAIYQDLTAHGYDAFYDFQSISSGNFSQVILENIKARAHFLVLLTPSALERCDDSGDWLRKEIETAIDEKRNIIPLMLENFDFGAVSTNKYLTGKLALLKNYNGLRVHSDYFEEGLTRLRERYLNVSLDTVIHPVSGTVQETTRAQQDIVNKFDKVEKAELDAQMCIERGNQQYEDKNYTGAIERFTDAIRLKPDLALSYQCRGKAFWKAGKQNEAISDCNHAIRLNPDFPEAYNYRGNAHQAKGDSDGAMKDYTEAIRLKPDYHLAYYNRGIVRKAKGDLDGAIKDYTEAIRLKPDYHLAYYNRGIARKAKGGLDGAMKDYTEAIRLKPDYSKAYYNRALIWEKKGDGYAAMADYQDCLKYGGGTHKKSADNALQRLKKKLGN